MRNKTPLSVLLWWEVQQQQVEEKWSGTQQRWDFSSALTDEEDIKTWKWQQRSLRPENGSRNAPSASKWWSWYQQVAHLNFSVCFLEWSNGEIAWDLIVRALACWSMKLGLYFGRYGKKHWAVSASSGIVRGVLWKDQSGSWVHVAPGKSEGWDPVAESSDLLLNSHPPSLLQDSGFVGVGDVTSWKGRNNKKHNHIYHILLWNKGWHCLVLTSEISWSHRVSLPRMRFKSGR